MPTANSAVGVQPIVRTSAIARRLRHTIIAASLGAAVLLPVGLFAAPGVAASVPSGGNDCSRWTSTTKPPDYIRVYRNKSGKIQRVPFRRYVITVLGKEWPGYLPVPVIEAGAVALLAGRLAEKPVQALLGRLRFRGPPAPFEVGEDALK